ncbi:MAG: UDP-N-acetylmuramate dehydrogenase, partial [Pseudomonadota bacterium]|nr:UDP-N-acetylmuramate dehydrogenase [Pseudomonadota bacterium]
MSLHANNPKPQMTRACVKPADLPEVSGKYITEQSLSGLTWFRVGGAADVIYLPTDADDLSAFLKNLAADIPVTVLGAGSNTLARDGGVRGVVIRLGRGFADIGCDDETDIRAGAGALDVRVAAKAADAGLSGLEFLSGIPGSIGGAVAMNAGAYGRETADVLVRVEAVTLDGEKRELTPDALNLGYRTNGYPDPVIYTAAVFRGVPADANTITAQMDKIADKRGSSQPIKSRTGGSTFKNPGGASADGPKAWKLIDAAGCRGLRVGEAQVSELHCNFLINHGNANAADIETLGETVRQRVLETSEIDLDWEIRRIGEV